MGCGTGQRQPQTPRCIDCITGKLRITVKDGQLLHQTSLMKMDPYVVLKLPNQQRKTTTIEKGSLSPSFNQTFDFYVNSCYKVYGRTLEIAVMDQHKIGADKMVGFGIVDLDPLVNSKTLKYEFKCYITYKEKDAGFINLLIEFIQEPARAVSFRFQNAFISRITSHITSMHCWIQVKMGEEILSTKKQKNHVLQYPSWANEVLTFNVPITLQNCLITLWDDNDIVGRMVLGIDRLFETDYEQIFKERLHFDGNKDAGTLKFQTIVGLNPQFSQIKYQKSQSIEKNDKIRDSCQYNQNSNLTSVGVGQEKKYDGMNIVKERKIIQSETKPLQFVQNRQISPTKEVKSITKTRYEDKNNGQQVQEFNETKEIINLNTQA